MPKPIDPEVNAMRTIAVVLAGLSPAEKERVVRWAYDKFMPPAAPPTDPYPEPRP